MLIFHRYDVYINLNNFVFQIPFQKGFSDIFNCFKVFSFRLYFMNFPLNIPAVVLPIIIPKFEVQRDLVLHLKQSPWVSCFPHERKFKSLQIVSNRMQVSVNIFKLLFQIFHDCCWVFFRQCDYSCQAIVSFFYASIQLFSYCRSSKTICIVNNCCFEFVVMKIAMIMM